MNFDLFKEIYFDRIQSLFELSKKSQENLFSVKNNYKLEKKFLLENLNFLIRINFLKIYGNKLKINIDENKNFKENIIFLILKEPGYGSCLKDYINNFKKDNFGYYIFKPSGAYNSETSDLRNFLITMGYVKNKEDYYLLEDDSILKELLKFKLSPEDLNKKLIVLV